MLEQMPVLHPRSTVMSIPCTNPCCMQPLIHVDTQSLGVQAEKRAGRSGRNCAKANNAKQRESPSHKPLWHPSCQGPQTGPNYLSICDLCWKCLAHRQMEQDGCVTLDTKIRGF